MTTRATNCADCGEPLDQFGICPFADPFRARIERAPVSCGHSATENTKTLRQTIAAASSRAWPAAFGGAQ